MSKSEKTKLPKSVAGIKVPKALRKSGAIEALIGSSAGRALMAGALTAAAAAAAEALTKASDPKSDMANGHDGSTLSEAVQAAAAGVASFLTEALQGLAPSSSTAAPEAVAPETPTPSPRARRTGTRKPKVESAASQDH